MKYKSEGRRAFEGFCLAAVIAGSMGWVGYMQRRQNTMDAALFDAAVRNNPEKLQALLDIGANPNIQWQAYPAPNFSDFCKQMVGIDPRKSARGRSPLMVAAKDGNLTIAKALLESRADVNLQDGEGHTALYLAAHSRRREGSAIVLLLTKHGAVLNAKATDLNARNPNNLQAREQPASDN